MRKTCLASLSFCLALAGAGLGRAEDRSASCHELLDKAIKAMGGEAKLAALKVAIIKTKGTFLFLDRIETTFSDEWFVDGDRYRIYLTGEVKGQQGQQFRESVVINGDQGWLGEDQTGRTRDLPRALLTAAKESLYTVRLVHRLPTLKSKPFELTPLGEIKVGDRQAVGLKVTQKGYPEVCLYFDQQTGLPAKSEVRLREFDIQAGAAGPIVTYAFNFVEHKDYDGLRHFSKVTLQRDGKQFYESTVVDISPLDQLNRVLFDRP